MDSAGGQWANQIFVNDGGSPTQTRRVQATDACLLMFGDPGFTKRAVFRSMDPDGFTLDFATSAAMTQLFSLALGGIPARVGAFDKTREPAPVTQTIAGFPFSPRFLLFASVMDVAGSAIGPHARFGIGLNAPGIGDTTAAFSDTNVLPSSGAWAVSRPGTTFVKIDNDRLAIDADLNRVTVTPDGFQARFTTNDAIATQITYLGLGGP
jgi:hypothetical protein